MHGSKIWKIEIPKLELTRGNVMYPLSVLSVKPSFIGRFSVSIGRFNSSITYWLLIFRFGWINSWLKCDGWPHVVPTALIVTGQFLFWFCFESCLHSQFSLFQRSVDLCAQCKHAISCRCPCTTCTISCRCPSTTCPKHGDSHNKHFSKTCNVTFAFQFVSWSVPQLVPMCSLKVFERSYYSQ